MNNDIATTVEALIAESRRIAIEKTPAGDIRRTLLVQLADALEESQRECHHKDAVAASWRRKCGEAQALSDQRFDAMWKQRDEARALADRWETECKRQMDLLADEVLLADRYKAALEAITVDSEYMAYRIAQQALRPVDAPSMDEKLEILDRVAGSWKDRPSEHDCWDLDDKTTCGLCEQFQTPASEQQAKGKKE